MRDEMRLHKAHEEIPIHLKKAPAVLFNRGLSDQNVLVIRIQPDEGISLRIQAKVPGTSFRFEPVKMDFHYGTPCGKASPDAYERSLPHAPSAAATRLARRSALGDAEALISMIRQ